MVIEKKPAKKFPVIGCCGIDCGLCPRYNAAGSSRCPGCCGPGFSDRHPGCSCMTCCVKMQELEACGQCGGYPCKKFLWQKKKPVLDSFVTHQKAGENQEYIKKHGIMNFIKLQQKRIKFLLAALEGFNDGRSKSLFCLAAALLPIEDLEAALKRAAKEDRNTGAGPDKKKTAAILRSILEDMALERRIELRLIR